MALQDFLVDPYAPDSGYQSMIDPTTGLVEEPEDPTEIPNPAVDNPWADLTGTEAGGAPQEEATTTLGDQFLTEDYGVPEAMRQGEPTYKKGPGMPQYEGGNKPPNWRTAAIKTGVTSAVTAGIGAYGSGGRTAVTVGVGEGGAGQYQQSNAGYGGKGGGPGMTNMMSAYAGYQASPYGAMFEQEYMGGYSPGYVGAGVTSPIFTMSGARNDKEARTARGQRIGMSGAGAIAGAMGGGGWGAVYGAGGAQFQENPYSGKRGYQEEWKYNFKPIIGGAWKDIESHSWGQGPGMVKGGMMRKSTNMENWKDTARYSVPGMGGLGGGGKKPPSKGEVKRDIKHQLASQAMKDFQIQEWWNVVAGKGSTAGRDYIKGGLETEGREWAQDESIPDWVQSGRYGKDRRRDYRYGPEEIGGKRVSSERMVNTLAGLQQALESGGSRKDFWNKYMKDYNMFQEGGAGYEKEWHGKKIYNIPSDIYGQTAKEMWGDSIDFDKNYSQDLDWLNMQSEEEGED